MSSKKVLGYSFPCYDEVISLQIFLSKGKPNSETVKLFDHLSTLDHRDRLSENLRNLLSLNVIGTNNTSISNLLLPKEKSALNELHSVNATTELKEIANGLLNIRERCLMCKAFDRPFRTAIDLGFTEMLALKMQAGVD